MDRRKVVARLLNNRDDLMVITGIGSATYDVAACGDHPLNFYIWSGLGCTPVVGLGLALARPDRRVAVITGDGDILMALGSLATIGIKQPKNLSLVVLDNGHYGATGMQPSATASGVDLAQIARACSFPRVEGVFEFGQVDGLRDLLHANQGPVFIHARVDADDQKRVIPSRDGIATKYRFMRAASE